jgi:hypothetical protein
MRREFPRIPQVADKRTVHIRDDTFDSIDGDYRYHHFNIAISIHRACDQGEGEREREREMTHNDICHLLSAQRAASRNNRLTENPKSQQNAEKPGISNSM